MHMLDRSADGVPDPGGVSAPNGVPGTGAGIADAGGALSAPAADAPTSAGSAPTAVATAADPIAAPGPGSSPGSALGPAPESARGLLPVRDLDDLAAALGGRLIRPADAGWDEARLAWQLLADQHPVAVVVAAGRHDVAITMRAAAALGLRVAAQATGHNAVPLGDLSRTILLRTAGLNTVEVDAQARTARIEAGATAGEVAAAAAAAGLAAIGGFSATVGAIGALLGGGLGWFARSHGPASASVLELELVTADGSARRAEAGSELFELVLDGADIAVITSVTIRLHPVGEVVAGSLFWPVDAAAPVFAAWTEWIDRLPESVTSTMRVLRFPEAPGVPPEFAGRAFAIVEAVVQGTPAEADALLAPLRALSPQLDTFAVMPPAALAGLHMDPPAPVPAMGRSALLRSLPADVVEALVTAVSTGPARILTAIELRHLGGALDRARGSAVAGSRALLYAVAVAASPAAAANPSPAAIAAARAAFDSLDDAVAPVRAARQVPTFTEAPTDPELLFGEGIERLRAAKRQWDPADRVHANHPVLRV